VINNVAQSDAVKRDDFKNYSDVKYNIVHYMVFQ